MVTNAFDVYTLRARLYPAFLMLLPATATAVLLIDLPEAREISVIFVAAGGMFLVANLVRGRGLTIQDRLIGKWDGLPTTVALRWATAGNDVLRARRHSQLEAVTGLHLPAPDEERADPRAADAHYEAAIRILIARVRERPDAFPRVQDENTSYGFRRNLYALKAPAIVVLGIALVGCFAAFLGDGLTGALLAAILVNSMFFTCWLLLINPDWVRQAGDRYAERLLDTLEDPTLLA